MVVGEAALAALAGLGSIALVALGSPRLLGLPMAGVTAVFGGYLALMALGMLDYSLRGKRWLRDRLLRAIRWTGHERVLDVGCGRGLLLIGAAHRLTDGTAIGVDRWVRGAVSGNGPDAALRNAQCEGVAERVEVIAGDARSLPFPDASFDVVLSNFVLHEMDSQEDRERMLREQVRVLKPGGHIALIDFIFTGQAVRVWRTQGVRQMRRAPAGRLAFLSFALLTVGLGRLYAVVGVKA
jgi:SAM-dependent methyltransferase